MRDFSFFSREAWTLPAITWFSGNCQCDDHYINDNHSESLLHCNSSLAAVVRWEDGHRLIDCKRTVTYIGRGITPLISPRGSYPPSSQETRHRGSLPSSTASGIHPLSAARYLGNLYEFVELKLKERRVSATTDPKPLLPSLFDSLIVNTVLIIFLLFFLFLLLLLLLLLIIIIIIIIIIIVTVVSSMQHPEFAMATATASRIHRHLVSKSPDIFLRFHLMQPMPYGSGFLRRVTHLSQRKLQLAAGHPHQYSVIIRNTSRPIVEYLMGVRKCPEKCAANQ